MSKTIIKSHEARRAKLLEWLPLNPRAVFAYCILCILLVSIYDSYMVVLYRKSILSIERNPICEFLIRQDPYSLTWFLVGKVLGNAGVIGTLSLLFWCGYRHTILIAKCLAFFQILLLVYLMFSDPLSGFLHFDGLHSGNATHFRKGMNSALIHLAILGPVLAAFVIMKWKRQESRQASLR